MISLQLISTWSEKLSSLPHPPILGAFYSKWQKCFVYWYETGYLLINVKFELFVSWRKNIFVYKHFKGRYKENTLVVDIDIDNTARPHITNSATVCRIQTKLPLNEAWIWMRESFNLLTKSSVFWLLTSVT